MGDGDGAWWRRDKGDNGGGRRRNYPPPKRRRTNDRAGVHKPVTTGLASVRLVQLLVRVADSHARATTDAESSLLDNLQALAKVVAAKDLVEDAGRVGRLVTLVARSSPLGSKPLAVLGGLLVAERPEAGPALGEAVRAALLDALSKGRRVEIALSLRFYCELASARAVAPPSGVLRALAEWLEVGPAPAESAAWILASCLATPVPVADRRALVASLEIYGKRRPQGGDVLDAGIRALVAGEGAPHLDPLDGWTGDDAANGLFELQVTSDELKDGLDKCGGLVLPALPGSLSSELTSLEVFVLTSLAVEVCSSFRVGARWDGIVVGDKAQPAKQLLAMPVLLRAECRDELRPHVEDIVIGAVLGFVAADVARDDGSISADASSAKTGDAILDGLHTSLELCRESPQSLAPRLANRIELIFREVESVDYCHAARLAKWFGHFLNNTQFKWPYWAYWLDAVEDTPSYDAQRRFLEGTLDAVVRLSYVDRLKCADGFPDGLHAFLPSDPTPVDVIDDDDDPGALACDSAASLAEWTVAADDERACFAAVRAALLLGRASISHSLSTLDALAEPLRDAAFGEEPREAACLDAVLAVWPASTFHVALFFDALVRRCIVRPRALAKWLLDDTNRSKFGLWNLASSVAPLELVDVAVDRSLDFVAAALHAAGAMQDDDDDDQLADQVDEAKEVALELVARLVAALQAKIVLGEDADDADRAWTTAAFSLLRHLAEKYDRAQKGQLPAAHRSAPPLALPKIIAAADLATVLHDGIEPNLAHRLRAIF